MTQRHSLATLDTSARGSDPLSDATLNVSPFTCPEASENCHDHYPLSWSPPPIPARATPVELGIWGEELAAAHLRARGYRILARNWRCARGELDIVASYGSRLAAIEVKTRRRGGQVPAIEAISRDKLARLRRLLVAWVSLNEAHAPALAVDLIAIDVYHGDRWRIHHIEGIQ
ncbi:YraN family protein [Arcanobacterium haemolyticum]|nr:YraN family protein [Arcanobacterium haemolyticum]